jgi:hypothetical protein
MPNKYCVPCNDLVINDRAKFCRKCGQELVLLLKCVCGYELLRHDKLCQMCGNPTGFIDTH